MAVLCNNRQDGVEVRPWTLSWLRLEAPGLQSHQKDARICRWCFMCTLTAGGAAGGAGLRSLVRGEALAVGVGTLKF